MVATFACVGALGLGATASGLAQREGWSWAALELGGGGEPPGEISGAYPNPNPNPNPDPYPNPNSGLTLTLSLSLSLSLPRRHPRRLPSPSL